MNAQDGSMNSGEAAAKSNADFRPNPMDELASEYDRWFDSPEGSELFQIELACVRRVVGSAEGRWLEVGVGTGRFAAALGIRHGVDPSEAALLLARSRGIDAIQGTAEQIPFPDRTFDGMLLVTTLCFVDDAQRAMEECRRALRDGGSLVMAIVPADSSWGRLYAEKGKRGHPFYSTAHFFTCRAVISLAESAGFKFRSASSCLLNPSGAPQSAPSTAGIVEDAGFVCLGFSAGD